MEDFISVINTDALPFGFQPRLVALHPGDEVYVSRNRYKVSLGEFITDTPLMCIKLIKRNRWWQFWKPKYKGAIYRAMGEV